MDTETFSETIPMKHLPLCLLRVTIGNEYILPILSKTLLQDGNWHDTI